MFSLNEAHYLITAAHWLSMDGDLEDGTDVRVSGCECEAGINVKPRGATPGLAFRSLLSWFYVCT